MTESIKKIKENFSNGIMYFEKFTPIITSVIFAIIALVYIWSLLFSIFIGSELKPYEVSPIYALYFLSSDNAQIQESLIFSGGIILLIAVGLVAMSARQKYLSSLFGDAHWATEFEIKQAGLRARDGIILGKTGIFNQKYLISDGPHNIAIVAPPRAGKGVGYVIPNNLNWKGSIITLDIRGQAYRETSGFRAKYSDVYKLDFLNPEGHTHHYNPLGFVDKENKITRIDGIDKITKKLWPPETDKGEIWQPEARTLFTSLALLLIDLKSTRFTLGEINRLILETVDFDEYLTSIIETYNDQLDPICIRGINGFLQKAPKEQSGVLSSIKAGLELWNNPLIDAATSSNDIDIYALKQKRISVYITTAFDDIERLGKLISLFFEQVISISTEHEPDENENHMLLLMMDEFSLLPKMRSIEKGVSFLSGYNVITMPIIQSLTQLESVYGRSEADTFLQTFKYRIFFAQNDGKAAQKISTDLGPVTKKNYSHSLQGMAASGGSTNQSYMKSDLMSANHVMRLDKKKGVLLIEASAPVLFNKIVWYKTKIFKDRETAPAALPNTHLNEYMQSLKTPAMNIKLKPSKSKDQSDDNIPPDVSDEEFASMVADSIGEF